MRRWDVLEQVIRGNGYRTFVEVGCKEGRTTGHLAKACPELQLYAIDPWRPMPENAGRVGGETYEDWDFRKIEAQFWTNVTPDHAPRVEQIRTTSLEAAGRFQDGTVDLVFIDAGHDYDNALADIRAWWPKVRHGGVLAGHDYQHRFPGVMRAVAETFDLMGVVTAQDSLWMVIKDTPLTDHEGAQT